MKSHDAAKGGVVGLELLVVFLVDTGVVGYGEDLGVSGRVNWREY